MVQTLPFDIHTFLWAFFAYSLSITLISMFDIFAEKIQASYDDIIVKASLKSPIMTAPPLLIIWPKEFLFLFRQCFLLVWLKE